MVKKSLPNDMSVIGLNRLPSNAAGLSFCDEEGLCPLEGGLDLCGDWRFRFVPSVGEEPGDYFLAQFNDADFDTVPVPSNWQLQGDYDCPIYTNHKYPAPVKTGLFDRLPAIDMSKNSVGIYRTRFHYSRPQGENTVILRFEGIQSAGYIYLNGAFVGYTEDSFGISEFDVSEHIVDGENVLAVKVLRYCKGSYLEDQDMWRMSGIIRPVSIYCVPKKRISDYFARCELTNDYKDGLFTLSAMTEAQEEGLTLTARLFLGSEEAYSFSAPFEKTKKGSAWQSAEIAGECKKPLKWSFEEPNLYRLVVAMKNSEGKALDIKSCDFGFRSVEIKRGNPLDDSQPELLFNGVSIKLRGVNRHEFHPDHGFAVPDSVNMSDLVIIKKMHCNAIRTSHYPPSPALVSMCDRLGLLVMCENNLETHGLARRIPRSKSGWRALCSDRLERMVKRYRNHPSVFMWSLGNECGKGKTFFYLARLCKRLDPTRPIHYECDHDCSDVVSAMYEPTEQLIRMTERLPVYIGQNIYNYTANKLTYKDYAAKPFLLCEYAHCMGNSLGNFAEYWDIFLKHKRFIGGFIWDFADQAIHSNGRYLYGGDFGDTPNDIHFCFNGLVKGDRSPNPAMFEAKYVMCPLRAELTGSRLTLRCLNYFVPTKSMTLEYMVFADGVLLRREQFPGLELVPYSKIGFTVDFSGAHTAGDVDLTVRVISEGDRLFEKGEIYYQQAFAVKRGEPAALVPCGNTEFSEENGAIAMDFCGRRALVSASDGKLLSMTTPSGREVSLNMLPNSFRPTTDNHTALGYPAPVRHFVAQQGGSDGRDKIKVSEITKGRQGLSARLTAPGMTSLGVSYCPLEDGRLMVKALFVPKTEIPKYGLQFSLDGDFDRIEYYGLGEQENYPDRCSGAVYGVFGGSPEKLFHRYLMPQEAGNRTEVMWARTENGKSALKITAPARFCFSAYPYTDRQIEEAAHEFELSPCGRVALNIDGGVEGVGGDKPAVACLKKRYTLPKGRLYTVIAVLELSDAEEPLTDTSAETGLVENRVEKAQTGAESVAQNAPETEASQKAEVTEPAAEEVKPKRKSRKKAETADVTKGELKSAVEKKPRKTSAGKPKAEVTEPVAEEVKPKRKSRKKAETAVETVKEELKPAEEKKPRKAAAKKPKAEMTEPSEDRKPKKTAAKKEKPEVTEAAGEKETKKTGAKKSKAKVKEPVIEQEKPKRKTRNTPEASGKEG